MNYRNEDDEHAMNWLYEEGLEHYKAEEYEKAFQSWLSAAEQGHAKAQFYLGAMYAHGEGVVQNVEQAIAWYTQAAEQGSAWAQNSLGFHYERGEGVPQAT